MAASTGTAGARACIRGQRAISVREGERGDRHGDEQAHHEGEQADHVDERKHQHEAEQRPFVAAGDARALFHRLDRTELAVDDDEHHEHEHQHEDDAWHDEQDQAEDDGKPGENRRAEKFPERLRMPERGELDRIGIVVRVQIKRAHPHIEQSANSEIEHRAEQRRVLRRARKRRVDAPDDRSGYQIDDSDDHARAHEEPRASLERLPAEADESSGRQFHAPDYRARNLSCPADIPRKNRAGRPKIDRARGFAPKRLARTGTKSSCSDFHLAMPNSLSLP